MLNEFTNPMSRRRIVRWMHEETGAPCRTEILEYGTSVKSPEHLAVNPIGKVPAVCHGDTVVTECAAICAYPADTFPYAGLAPPLPCRGAYYRWLFFAAGPLEASVTNKACGLEPPEDKRGMVAYGSFEAVMHTLELAVAWNAYIAADRFKAADVYVGAHVGWGMQFGSIEERSPFTEYWARVSDRDDCRRATELGDAAILRQP